jgi:hypothetical protein
VTGVNWQTSIMPIRVSNNVDGTAYLTDLADCIYYAADHGAKVASLSFAGLYASSEIDQAAIYMRGKGGLTVVAAGNDGSDISAYPNSPNYLTVGAVGQSDVHSSFSNWGTSVDLVAPGENILTTLPNNMYVSESGTSLSAPMVAGVAALIYSLNPNFTPAEVEGFILSTATDLGPVGKDLLYGTGRLNAGAAVQAAAAQVQPLVTKGYIDAVKQSATGGVDIQGWACIIGSPSSTTVNIYAGGAPGTGTLVTTASANVASEPGIATSCRSTGKNYRYNVHLTPAQQTSYALKSVYATAANSSTLLGQSGTFTIPTASVPSTTKGFIDTVKQSATGGVDIQGWACIIGSPAPTTVNIYAGAPGVGTVLFSAFANAPSSAAVATACGSTGTNYRFNFHLTAAQQAQYALKFVYATAASTQALLSQSGLFAIPGVPSNSGTPYSGSPVALPAIIQAEQYNLGGEGVGYHDTSPANYGGQLRTDGVDVEYTGDSGGGYDIGWTDVGEYVNYAVTVPATRTFDINLRMSRGVAGVGTVHLLIDGVDVSGKLSVQPTGGWQTYINVGAPKITLAAGLHNVRVLFETGDMNLNWIEFK